MGHLKKHYLLGCQNEERTGSNRVASHSCSSGASAAACTDVVSILETSTEQESIIVID